MKVPAAAVAAECMGAAAAMVGLPEHRPFIANIFLFLLFVPFPFLLMFHMLPLCSENCAKGWH